MRFKGATNVLSLILIDDVLEIDLVEVVGPGVKNLEALILHVLTSVSFNVGLDELVA